MKRKVVSTPGRLLCGVTCLLLLLCSVAEAKTKLKLSKVGEVRINSPWPWPEVATDPSGRYTLVADQATGEIQIIDWEEQAVVNRKHLSQFPCQKEESYKNPSIAPFVHLVREVRFVPGTSWVALVWCDALYIVDFPKLEIIQKLTDETREEAFLEDVAPNGKYIVARIYPVERGFRLFSYEGESWAQLVEWKPPWSEGIYRLRFTPGSDRLVAYRSDPYGVDIYDIATARLVGQYPDPAPEYQSLSIHGLYFDGESVVELGHLTEEPSFLVRYQFPGRKGIRVIPLKTKESSRIWRWSISPDGMLLAAETCYNVDSLLCRPFTIWDTETGEVLRRSRNGLNIWFRFALPNFSPDGKHLVILKNSTIEIYEIRRESE